MKSLWFQLVLWFGITFIAISAAFLFVVNLRTEPQSPYNGTAGQAGISQSLGRKAQSAETPSTINSRSIVRLQSAYGLT